MIRYSSLRAIPDATVLTPGDLVGLVLFALPALILSVWSLFRQTLTPAPYERSRLRDPCVPAALRRTAP